MYVLTVSESGTFGDRLKAAREAAGLSVGKLAQAVEVTEGAIRQMESGQTKSASLKIGIRLARALQVSSEMLAGEPGPRLLRSAEALPRQIVARASQSKGMPQGADSNDPSVDDVRERLDELLSSGGTSGPDLNDGPFKLLGLNDRAQRVAFHAIVAGNLLPFVELLAQTRKATQALLAEPSLSEDVRRRAIEALGP